ncbi:MAG TPA: low affinity iron permease family protein [Candidatus Saccharimonadales bacterium]|nr:low affinity iron permease family protein [Candidatus Saccharimonadales bacterium]
MKNVFRAFSAKISALTGTAYAFVGAILIVALWAVTGPAFGYSDTWQLVINTGTTIVTFLMVFLIQNTQNRDSKAMQLKLDELIRATQARTAFVDLEDLSDDELAQLDREFRDLHEKQAAGAVMKRLHKSVQLEHEIRKSGARHSAEKLNEILHKIRSLESKH